MFGLKIGDIINTKNKDGWKEFPISMFEKDKNGCWWAILGKINYLKNFGHYGDQMWLIKTPEMIKPCWSESKWLKKGKRNLA